MYERMFNWKNYACIVASDFFSERKAFNFRLKITKKANFSPP